MEELCLTLRSKKNFLRLHEKKSKTNKYQTPAMHPSLLLCDFTDTLLMFTRQAHQPEYRKLLFVEKNRAQTAYFCYSVPACLQIVFLSVRCSSRVNQNPGYIQVMELPQDHQQRLLYNKSHLN